MVNATRRTQQSPGGYSNNAGGYLGNDEWDERQSGRGVSRAQSSFGGSAASDVTYRPRRNAQGTQMIPIQRPTLTYGTSPSEYGDAVQYRPRAGFESRCLSVFTTIIANLTGVRSSSELSASRGRGWRNARNCQKLFRRIELR